MDCWIETEQRKVIEQGPKAKTQAELFVLLFISTVNMKWSVQT